MKFLLEFVYCCGAAAGNSSGTEEPEFPIRKLEETRSLVRLKTLKRRGRMKRSRGGVARSASEAEWKPTLCSISEDNVALEEVQVERMVKRKGSVGLGGGSGGDRRSRNSPAYVEDYRQNHFAVVIPAFSPAPFMI